MKRLWIAVCILTLCVCAFARAEAPEAERTEDALPEIEWDYSHLVAGNATPFDGKFFTQMWGNATSDLDVRSVLFGYDLTEWNAEAGTFEIDPSVVSGLTAMQSAAGDRIYTFSIYHDLQYSDGTPITAWDYAFSILLSVDPAIRELGGKTRMMDYIQGCADYAAGRARVLSGVRVLNDWMMSVTVGAEYLPFFYELGWLDIAPYPISMIAPGCRVRDDGEGIYVEGGMTAELLAGTILGEGGYLTHPGVTSGPYRLLSFDGKTAELEINPYYKGDSAGVRPTIERITYETTDSLAGVEALSEGRKGLLDKCVTAETIDRGMALVTRDPRFTNATYPRIGMAYVTFCCERPALSSIPVRQAVSHCLDKDALVSSVVGNYGLRVDGYYGLGQWMFQLMSGAIAYPLQEPAENATAEELAAYEQERAAWEQLTMDGIPVYGLDIAAAVDLLERDGWTLNREGGAYDAEKDGVRCKRVNGELTALELRLLCPEENAKMQEALRTLLGANMEKAGMSLAIETAPMREVLHLYYRKEARDYDMIFMASDFDPVFDPSVTFMPDAQTQNAYNRSAVNDLPLYQLAESMRRTEPGDLLTYLAKWISFQERFQQVAPMIPLYSNVYFDFYPRELQGYEIGPNVTWCEAVSKAVFAELPEEPEEEAEEEVFE